MNQAASDQRCNQGYGSPVVQTPSQPAATTPIVVNQPVPVAVVTPVLVDPNLFKLDPVQIQCPLCSNMITTNVVKSWNCGACCLCCVTGLLIYLLLQISNNKSFLCCNAKHVCPTCGGEIASYKAC